MGEDGRANELPKQKITLCQRGELTMLDITTSAQSSLPHQAPAKGQHPGLYIFATTSSLGMTMFFNQMVTSNGYVTERNDRNA